MNKTLKILIIAIVLSVGLIGLAFYSFLQLDFIGSKDPKVVKANIERWDKMLLEAEYRNGTDYCKINLLDSVNIEINVGDAVGGVILTEKYYLSDDTIIIIDGIKHADKYINSSKMIIQNDRILYLIDDKGNFDTIQTMKVKFNKLNNFTNGNNNIKVNDTTTVSITDTRPNDTPKRVNVQYPFLVYIKKFDNSTISYKYDYGKKSITKATSFPRGELKAKYQNEISFADIPDTINQELKA